MKAEFVEKVKKYNEGRKGKPDHPYTFSLNVRMDKEDWKNVIAWCSVANAIFDEIKKRKLDEDYIIKRVNTKRKDSEVVLWTIDLS